MKNLQYFLLFVFTLSGILSSCNSKGGHASVLLAFEDSIEIALGKEIESYRRAINALSIDEHETMSDYYKKMSRVCASMQAYRCQREKAIRAEIELANNRIIFYRVVVVSLLVIFLLTAISYRKERHKRKLERQLENAQRSAMEIRAKQQETEFQLLLERAEREKVEIVRLNQTVDYYKRLNAISVPALLKSQKRTMLHLTDEEWDIVARNTDACFDGFTGRLSRLCPQLTEEDIRFCYLVKMELSISLLAKIYHIASGSISRKKMRLKAKMGIENLTLDEFIRTF